MGIMSFIICPHMVWVQKKRLLCPPNAVSELNVLCTFITTFSRGHFRFLLFWSYTGHDWPVRIHNFWPMNLVVSTVSGSILCSEQSMTATLCHVHKCYICELLIHLPGLHWTWDQRKLQFQEKEELCNILILLKMTIAAPDKFLVLMRKFWEQKQIWWAIDLS